MPKGVAPGGVAKMRPENSDDGIEYALNYFHETFAEPIRVHLAEFEIAAKIDGPNQRFRDLLTSAIVGCVFQHRIVRLKRLSEYRSDLLKLANNAEEAVITMRKLSALWELKQRIIEYFETDETRVPAFPDVNSLTRLARAAKLVAQPMKDKGGPTEMHAFRVLITGLARAFEAGRGRRASVTRSSTDDSYRGDFMQLVRAVEPLAVQLAESGGSKRLPLKRPGKASLGKYVESALRARRSSDAMPSRQQQPK